MNCGVYVYKQHATFKNLENFDGRRYSHRHRPFYTCSSPFPTLSLSCSCLFVEEKEGGRGVGNILVSIALVHVKEARKEESGLEKLKENLGRSPSTRTYRTVLNRNSDETKKNLYYSSRYVSMRTMVSCLAYVLTVRRYMDGCS